MGSKESRTVGLLGITCVYFSPCIFLSSVKFRLFQYLHYAIKLIKPKTVINQTPVIRV